MCQFLLASKANASQKPHNATASWPPLFPANNRMLRNDELCSTGSVNMFQLIRVIRVLAVFHAGNVSINGESKQCQTRII